MSLFYAVAIAARISMLTNKLVGHRDLQITQKDNVELPRGSSITRMLEKLQLNDLHHYPKHPFWERDNAFRLITSKSGC